MQKNLRLIVTLAIVFAILLLVNLGASLGLRGAKVDLTEENLYTLSDGSRQMLENLENRVTLKLFYSRRAASNLPMISQYAERVIEMLRQYESVSDGKVALEIYEPRPDTEVEEQALRYGIQPFARAGIENIYFGLAIVSEIGDEQVIPFIDPSRESFLEYDLSSLIAGVASPEKETIGVMSAHSVLGGAPNDPMTMFQQQAPQEPWALARQLRSTYDVQEVPLDAQTIPEGIDLLLVIHPKGIEPPTEYAIDQFLMRGGRAIVLVDALSEYDRLTFQNPDPSARFSADFTSNLPTLFESWGLSFDTNRVLGDLDLATEVRMGPQAVRHPAWLTLTPEQMNQDEIVSSGLESMIVASPGVLSVAEESPYEITTLLHSTEVAGSWEAFRLKFGADPETLSREIEPGTEQRPLAVRVMGDLATAFPEGPPEGWTAPEDAAGNGDAADDQTDAAAEAPMRGHLTKADAPTSVIVVADSDLVADDFSVQKQNFFGSLIIQTINDNLSFVNNAVDYLVGSPELIGLRTRGRSARPFTLVDELEREAQRQWKDEEDMLNARLEEVNRQLAELQQGKAEGQEAILSQAQLEQIEQFEAELATTRERLREVRRNLRQDIEALGFRIKFINIALVPLLVVLAGFIPLAWRAARMRSARA